MFDPQSYQKIQKRSMQASDAAARDAMSYGVANPIRAGRG